MGDLDSIVSDDDCVFQEELLQHEDGWLREQSVRHRKGLEVRRGELRKIELECESLQDRVAALKKANTVDVDAEHEVVRACDGQENMSSLQTQLASKLQLRDKLRHDL